jgi:hypothetical protein
LRSSHGLKDDPSASLVAGSGAVRSASPDPQTGVGQGRLLIVRGADVTLWCCGSSNTALLLAKTDAIKALLRAHGATE